MKESEKRLTGLALEVHKLIQTLWHLIDRQEYTDHPMLPLWHRVYARCRRDLDRREHVSLTTARAELLTVLS